jgi:hypothetical protein
MHEGQSIDYPHVIDLDNYPLTKVIDNTGSNYFTNSIAYMIAYAITFTQAKTINIYGIDMEVGSEYQFERPCITYWIGYARAKGININMVSGLTDSIFNYGYDTEKKIKLLALLENREIAYKKHAELTAGDVKNQWIGAMYAMQKLIELLKD